MATKTEVRNLGLASLGGVLEYFDFQVYVFVAAGLSLDFFPAGASPWTRQVQVFGIYAIGFLVRPVAGVVVAHFADRIGRKKMFVLTVLLMSGPTFLMGLLPTYADIGWLAPAMLLVLRVLQGFAVGGELPGASVFVSEHAPARRLGLWSGTFQGIVNCGLLLGAGAGALAAALASDDPSFASLSWRLPFVLGGTFGFMAAYLRRHLAETPMFEAMKRRRGVAREVPMATVLRSHQRQCAFTFALVFVFASTSGVYFQYLPTYLKGLNPASRTLVDTASNVGIVLFVLGMPLWGMVRDRFGWSRTLAASALLNAAVCMWFFNLLGGPGLHDATLILGYAVVGLCAGCVHAMVPGLISSLFPTEIRQSGFAFPYSTGTAIIGGLTPLTLAWLTKSYGAQAPMAQYLLACAIALGLSYAVRFQPQHLGAAAPASDASLQAATAD